MQQEPPPPNCQIPSFQADGQCYIATRRIVPWGDVPTSYDGTIAACNYNGPAADGECNISPDLTGAPM